MEKLKVLGRVSLLQGEVLGLKAKNCSILGGQ
jgi:hypothetical protein